MLQYWLNCKSKLEEKFYRMNRLSGEGAAYLQVLKGMFMPGILSSTPVL